MSMEERAPADIFMAWVRSPGPAQAFLRWLALIPGIVLIYLFFQLILLFAVSALDTGGDRSVSGWLMNMLNAAFLPFVIVRYGTPIAPSCRRSTSIALAVLGIGLVMLPRIGFEIAHPSQAPARYVWLTIGAAVCCASAWRGVRDVKRKLLLPASSLAKG